jgi:hypothetical protein
MTSPPAQGRQPTIGVTFLAWLNIYQNLKQAIQDVIAPEMQRLFGEIKAQNGEIKALAAEIRAVQQQLELFQSFTNRQFDVVDKRLDSLKADMDQRFSSLKTDMDQRFGSLKADIDGLDKRIDSLDKRIDGLAGDWRLSLDVHERLAALEARLERR